jgi:hypothetical protein
MEKFKNYLSTASGCMILLLTLTFINVGYVVAEPPIKDVKVINTPSEPVPTVIQGTASVAVVNEPSEPVPVRVMNESTFIPWRASFDLELAEGEQSRMVAFPEIPAGKRLVIELATAQLLVRTEQVPYIQLYVGGVGYYLALSNIGSYAPAQYVWMATHSLRLYADEGGYVRCLRAGGTASPFFASLSLSGYLVDLP